MDRAPAEKTRGSEMRHLFSSRVFSCFYLLVFFCMVNRINIGKFSHRRFPEFLTSEMSRLTLQRSARNSFLIESTFGCSGKVTKNWRNVFPPTFIRISIGVPWCLQGNIPTAPGKKISLVYHAEIGSHELLLMEYSRNFPRLDGTRAKVNRIFISVEEMSVCSWSSLKLS